MQLSRPYLRDTDWKEKPMALSLSMRKNEDVLIGEQSFIVSEVLGGGRFFLQNSETGKSFEITELEAVEVMSDVFVSAGEYDSDLQVRVVIDAPREVFILRGEAARRGRGGKV